MFYLGSKGVFIIHTGDDTWFLCVTKAPSYVVLVLSEHKNCRAAEGVAHHNKNPGRACAMRIPHIFSASFCLLLLVSPNDVTTPVEKFSCGGELSRISLAWKTQR